MSDAWHGGIVSLSEGRVGEESHIRREHHEASILVLKLRWAAPLLELPLLLLDVLEVSETI